MFIKCQVSDRFTSFLQAPQFRLILQTLNALRTSRVEQDFLYVVYVYA